MQSFAFHRELKYGNSIKHTLGETISLTGDHIVLVYQNDLQGDGQVLNTKKELRRIDLKFSEEDRNMKDV